MESASNSSIKPLWVVTYAAIVLFAAVFVWFAGHRGVFLLDQSIMFDGAWRIFQGQKPYLDFFSAFPPVAFVVQAIFFRIAGVDFSAMVASAAALNALAVACVMYVVGTLLPGRHSFAAAAGLLTAVWFQAPFGTLWFEQTAFAFNLLSLVCLLRATTANRVHAMWLRVGAGILLTAAMLSKQNAGGEFLPLAIGVAALAGKSDMRMRFIRSGQVCAGLALGASVFLFWLFRFSSPAGFWHDYVLMSREIVEARSGSSWSFLLLLWSGAAARCILAALILLLALKLLHRSPEILPCKWLITWMVFGGIFYQSLFELHTSNDVENCLPYIGLIYGLSLGCLSAALVKCDHVFGRNVLRSVFATGAAVVLGAVFLDGASISWSRKVQEFRPGTTFSKRLNVPGMSRLEWGSPTIISHPGILPEAELTTEDFEHLNAWLDQSNRNFFVFKDSILLYGLHHRPSPQPWLYFSPGHGFKMDEIKQVDAAVVAALQRNKVEVIILEKQSWIGAQDLWKDMPQFKNWMSHEFQKVKEFGIYEVYEVQEHSLFPAVDSVNHYSTQQ